MVSEKQRVGFRLEYIAEQSGLSLSTVKKYAKLKKQPVVNGHFLWRATEAENFIRWLRISTGAVQQ
jgi:phosphopantothenoylcysteine synthetase/decarboxylase